jgi:hypothetical protein
MLTEKKKLRTTPHDSGPTLLQFARKPEQPWRLRFVAGELRLMLSVDDRVGNMVIRREQDLPVLCHNGEKITDSRSMWKGRMLTCDEHVEQLHQRTGDREIVAYVGNGNLLANFGYVAWLQGRIYHLEDEPIFQRSYPSIVSRKDGSITIEDAEFADENGKTIVILDREKQHPSSSAIDFVTSGVPLVRHRKALPLKEVARHCYDLRHVVRPLALRLNGTTLYFPHHQLRRGLINKAVNGPIHLELVSQVDNNVRLPLTLAGWLNSFPEYPKHQQAAVESFLRYHGVLAESEILTDQTTLTRIARYFAKLLQDSLGEAGYREVAEVKNEGEFHFINNHCEIHMLTARYPHNVFVRWSDACGFVQFPGESGRSGATIPEMQDYLCQDPDVEDALLLDNGGDVRMNYRGQYLIRPFLDRPEMRSILALSQPVGAQSIGRHLIAAA